MPIPARKTIKIDLVSLLAANGPTSTTTVYTSLASKWALTSAELLAERSGGPLYQNEIRWARQELVAEGAVAKPIYSGRAVWKLNTGLEAAGHPEQNEIDPKLSYSEGALKRIEVNAYERCPKARNACLEHHGYQCAACGFDFEKTYGAVGKGRIHVHHIVEISSIGVEYEVNPITDLVPLCPNCHYIAHQRRPAFEVKELKAMLAANK